MSKTYKRSAPIFDEYDEYPTDKKTTKDRRKNKRVTSALRTRDIEQLMRLVDED